MSTITVYTHQAIGPGSDPEVHMERIVDCQEQLITTKFTPEGIIIDVYVDDMAFSSIALTYDEVAGLSTTIYAAPYDTHPDFPIVADAWYYQVDGRWVAVVREWEPEDDWFEDGSVDWPTPRTYPITERPLTGEGYKLIYRLSDGTEVSEIA